ncbi:molybdate ABC transporter substrate-binding protein [Brooklawnia cerclae]|uniref:Molybdate transport system substrate-binding protein n=1 Tax=Brooklawnia cerclae TaxID=349934 RepID=A0ABX0SDM8_9ACTN|nr:molybdate ABC transporter substrate-binding protein [Brooklawnia cerclae]NIH55994.1 molybdate transport system substrate-binding protein [Brooklawnia cerclae]
MKRLAAAALLLTLSLTACGQSGDSSTSSSSSGASASSSAAGDLSGSITVYAAASLQKTFTELGDDLMAANPDLDVEFVFAGSSDLVSQLQSGAPGDVFASADEKNMTKATDAALIDGDPVPFVTNHLTIVTAPGNPHGIASLADLANPDLKVVICAEQVPCGSATKSVTELAGVTLTPVSEENAVTGVLTKVTSGEADAGLVYGTDAKGAGDEVTAVDFDEAAEVTNVYPIGLLKSTTNAEGAQAFIDLVLSEAGKSVFDEAGFGPAEG